MNATVLLPDKRVLGYDDAGDPGGKVVSYFHGVPSAAAEWRLWGNEQMLKDLGVWLIAIDRPGVGHSTFQPNRRLSDWPADVTALADNMDIRRFKVQGCSGGTHAAFAAYKIPQRLIKVALVSSLAPFIFPGN